VPRGLCLLVVLGGCKKSTEPLARPAESSASHDLVSGPDEIGGDGRDERDLPVITDDSGADPTVETIDVDGVKLELVPDECQLSATFVDDEQSHHFAFPGACHFSPDPEGQAWVVATDHGKALLVESWVPLAEGDCDTALQLVIITQKGPELSSQIQRVSGCGPGPWDEMMYHVLAAQRVPLGSQPLGTQPVGTQPVGSR